MDSNKKIPFGLLIFDFILLLAIVGMFFLIYDLINPPQKKENIAYKLVKTHSFDDISLEAKAAFVFDISRNEVLFKKNETLQFPLASLTKLMTALTASELLPENSKITIRKEFLMEDGDTGLLVGESWKMKDLLDFSLVVSSNDGTRSLASVIGAMNLQTKDYDMGRKEFISKMNSMAEKLNLKQTYFVNESGLDEGKISGGYGSAENVGKLLEYIITKKPEILEATKYKISEIDSLNKTHTAKNTNTEIDKIPGIIASKTGYTDLAGGNLAIVFDVSMGRPIVVVVLGSSEKGRFGDVEKLVGASMDYVRTE